jgi:hypothetical protein
MLCGRLVLRHDNAFYQGFEGQVGNISCRTARPPFGRTSTKGCRNLRSERRNARGRVSSRARRSGLAQKRLWGITAVNSDLLLTADL